MTVYLVAFALTVLIEVPLARELVPSPELARGRAPFSLVALLLNAFTHPLATLAVHRYDTPFLVVELAVFAGEALGFRLVAGLRWGWALGVAAVCNTLTASLSVLG